MRRLRAAAVMGVTWMVAWAPVGVLIGLVLGGNRHTPDGFPADDWVMPLAVLGFVGGAMTSALFGVAERRRSFNELSASRFGAWGALAGLGLGALALAAWWVDPGYGPVLWPRALAIIGSTTLLSAASASGSLALAQRAGERAIPTRTIRAHPG